MYILEDISLEQLSILGVTQEYQLLIGCILTLCLLYLLLRPMTLFLHYRHYNIVLSYVISSLLMFMLFTLFAVLKGNLDTIRIGLQGIAIFGVCHIIFMIYSKIKYTYR